jgi:peptide/nickel transport system substrate-binding protein
MTDVAAPSRPVVNSRPSNNRAIKTSPSHLADSSIANAKLSAQSAEQTAAKPTRQLNHSSEPAKSTATLPPPAAKPNRPPTAKLYLKSGRKVLRKSERVALRHMKKWIGGRFDNLREARREVIGWLSLVAVLIAVGVLQNLTYAQPTQQTAPVSGGTLAVGMVDQISTINPLYATTDAEKAVSGLVYPGLLSYDANGKLRGELAASWQADENGLNYTIKLRPDLVWSDGAKISADDVLTTVNLLKNTAVGSPLGQNWRAISVAKIDPLTVKFTLKRAYNSFPFLLTTGLLPAHVLGKIAPGDVRNFIGSNLAKIMGAGAFKFNSAENSDQLTLYRFRPNAKYWRGAARVSTLTVRTYKAAAALARGFKSGEINVASGLNQAAAAEINPKQLTQTTLGDGVFAFFNTGSGLTSDAGLREALRLGLDRPKLRQNLVAKTNLTTPADLETPLARGILPAVDALEQPKFDAKAAAAKLDKLGWTIHGKTRQKDGQDLKINMATVAGTDYARAAELIAEQWRQLGITVELNQIAPGDLQQSTLAPRAYDVLVYQLHLGSDPDVYAFWHSSQATANGLNLSNYRSSYADIFLSTARSRTSSDLTAARYTDFAQTWLDDAPAIALYQPNYYTAGASDVRGQTATVLADPSERFVSVQTWTARVDMVRATP